MRVTVQRKRSVPALLPGAAAIGGGRLGEEALDQGVGDAAGEGVAAVAACPGGRAGWHAAAMSGQTFSLCSVWPPQLAE